MKVIFIDKPEKDLKKIDRAVSKKIYKYLKVYKTRGGV